jgi:hypothetical protein
MRVLLMNDMLFVEFLYGGAVEQLHALILEVVESNARGLQCMRPS